MTAEKVREIVGDANTYVYARIYTEEERDGIMDLRQVMFCQGDLDSVLYTIPQADWAIGTTPDGNVQLMGVV